MLPEYIQYSTESKRAVKSLFRKSLKTSKSPIFLTVNRIRLTKEERTKVFLEWYDGLLEERGWRSEQVATKGSFDSSVITAYRKGRSSVGNKVAEGAARAFGYNDNEVLALLQKLQLVPGGDDEASEEDNKVAQKWARRVAKIDDDGERQRIIGIVDAILNEAIKPNPASRQAPGRRRASGSSSR